MRSIIFSKKDATFYDFLSISLELRFLPLFMNLCFQIAAVLDGTFQKAAQLDTMVILDSFMLNLGSKFNEIIHNIVHIVLEKFGLLIAVQKEKDIIIHYWNTG